MGIVNDCGIGGEDEERLRDEAVELHAVCVRSGSVFQSRGPI